MKLEDRRETARGASSVRMSIHPRGEMGCGELSRGI